MKVIPLILELLYDLAMLSIGSYGAYILFKEFVEGEHISSLRQAFSILRKRWYALLALAIAIGLFLHHLFIGLNR
jgi:hypothetical protein